MANIRFITKGSKNPSHFFARFYHSKDFDYTVKTGLLINPKFWNNKLQRFKTITEEIPDKAETIKYTEELKAQIVSEYNKSYKEGEIISNQWLSNIVNKFNKRAKDGADYEIFFTPFIKKWIEESKTRIVIDSGKVVSPKTISKYKSTLKTIKEFEKENKIRLKHSDINLKFHGKFVAFLVNKALGNSTIEKYISQIKTFCRDAEAEDYNISPEYKNRKFTFKRNKPLDPYLNEQEIQSIFDLKISDIKTDKMRDLLIIGLWTGLRISDFKQYKRLKIEGDNILISSTKKTDAPVTIPIHPQVREVLNKRKGKLPKFNLSPSTLEIQFNKKIKEICKDAGITTKIIGDKKNKEINRNVRGIYPKYKLISSHICRRSFVTNHYGRIPNQAIMAITTHKSEKQLIEYVKISNAHYVEMVRDLWKKEESTKLKIV
ncbi:tyrosine-type recombinase/integrase [Tenacibaculum maritimum]|uniref:tyrosine-type recombinase/integrase n=1 Tax=Tenacibaculum maritimum TaxID=107401 RepID=UPI003875B5C5